MKRRVKYGFTLVEVSLFLAVTGLLFIGIVAGVQGSLSQQRYNDSVQSFAEFLRGAYSQVMNVENVEGDGGGRTELAIYGKLIVFGESKNFQGAPNDDGATYIYTVVGGADDIESNNTMDALKEVGASVVIEEGSAYKLAGIAEQYFTRWGAAIQTINGWDGGYEPFKGAVLIARNPKSGAVFTYFNENTIEINRNLKDGNLVDKLDNFKIQDVNFCINPDGDRKGRRRNIRIVAGARNSSGVEVIAQDGEENQCKN